MPDFQSRGRRIRLKTENTVHAAHDDAPELFLAWAWLAKAKGHSCHTKNSTLAKTFTEKTSKSAKHACHYATKERPVKITMLLGLDIIIKIKFTTIFDRCAILNVLN